ncbi:HNH endonuclease signature motif containing protein [Streptomyces sp. 35M1]|uniref:HNH endonuclease n=1 Tax=Streptomyces sp. 35M1 TaxID=3142978 RepID=UPI003990DAB6
MGDFPANGVDVDHVRPLFLGGKDVDTNVQVLCHSCHQLKTATEFGRAGVVLRDKVPPRHSVGEPYRGWGI